MDADNLKEIEELYMKLPMFKESFLPWLEEAKITLNRVKRDYEAKDISGAIYNMQQSLEKSIKYVHLSIGVITERDAKFKISHKPEKLFRKALSEWKLNEYQKSYDKDLLIIEPLNLKERIDYLIPKLEQKIKCIYAGFKISGESIIKYYLDNIVIDKDLQEFAEKTLKEEYIRDVSWEYVYWIQYYLSLILCATESNTRYPDVETNYSPNDKYSETSDIVQWIPVLIEAQEKSLIIMEKYK